MGCVQSRINPTLAEHLEFHMNTHLKRNTRSRVSATTSSAQNQKHVCTPRKCSLRRSCQREVKTSSLGPGVYQRKPRAPTAQAQRREAAPSCRELPQCRCPLSNAIAPAAIRQLCRDSWTAPPLLKNNGQGKASNLLQNLILPFGSDSYFTNVKESSIF